MSLTVRSSSPASADAAGIARSLADNRLLLRMLDEMEYGMLLVDGAGRLHHSNVLGREELFDGAILRLRDGILGPSSPDRAGDFRRALGQALAGRRELLTFFTGVATVTLAVTPLADGDGDGDAPGRFALLVFGRRPDTSGLAIHFFARAHGLTGAESTVLQQLANGLNPGAIAARQRVAISTVRSHITSIRAKTRKASVRELLDSVAMLPPIRALKRSSGHTLRPIAASA